MDTLLRSFQQQSKQSTRKEKNKLHSQEVPILANNVRWSSRYHSSVEYVERAAQIMMRTLTSQLLSILLNLDTPWPYNHEVMMIWIFNVYQSKHTRQKSLPEIHETMRIHDTKVRPTIFITQTNFNHTINKQWLTIMSSPTWKPNNDATFINIKDLQLILMKKHQARWTPFLTDQLNSSKWRLTGIRY